MPKEDQIPAGSRPVDQEPETPTPAAEPEESGTEAPEKFAGKSAEEITESYQALEKKMGTMGDELGKMRELNQALLSAVEQAKGQENAPAVSSELPGIEAIRAAVAEGTMDVDDAIQQVYSLGETRASEIVSQKFQEYEEQRQAKDLYNKFIADNPDYNQVVQSGVLDQIKSANPMHDDFSAFQVYKAQEEIKAAYEKGKEETAKIATGAEATKKVLGQEGATAREVNTPKQPLSRAGVRNNMLEAMKKSRAT